MRGPSPHNDVSALACLSGNYPTQLFHSAGPADSMTRNARADVDVTNVYLFYLMSICFILYFSPRVALNKCYVRWGAQ